MSSRVGPACGGRTATGTYPVRAAMPPEPPDDAARAVSTKWKRAGLRTYRRPALGSHS